MARRYRPRKRFKFLLYRDVELEIKLAEYLDYLRSNRQFVTVIKNSLRLFWSLSEGDISVLTELFPGIVQSLKGSTPPVPDTSGLERRLDQLQDLLLQQGTGSSNGLEMTGRALPAPQIEMPVFHDDDDMPTIAIRKDTSAGAQSASNLLAAMEGIAAVKSEEDTPAMRRAIQ